MNDLRIRGGLVADPETKTLVEASVTISDGRIVHVGKEEGESTEVLDATGCIVCPGFVDTHMHDEELDDPHSVERALLRQGVTTAIAGNCGSGPLLGTVRPKRQTPWLNLGYLTGHRILRESVGVNDIYRPATPGETTEMQVLLERELSEGSFGLSLGLEYVPNTDPAEIAALADVVAKFPRRWISIHIRFDGPRCLEAIQEAIDIAARHRVRVQISHFGSMTAFGRLQTALDMVDQAYAAGTDVTFDCYPYAAFCTSVGSAVFDPGFEDRWNKDVGVLEAGSGKFKGQRLTKAMFEEMRSETPTALIIAHVLNESEVRTCLRHPRCAIASDAVLRNGEGHPRAAGTFPRGLRILREEGLSWPEALAHATSIPAEMTWLDRGTLRPGSVADLVLFEPERFTDKATFSDQLAPPEGIRAVLLGGRVAVREGTITEEPLGTFLLRR